MARVMNIDFEDIQDSCISVYAGKVVKEIEKSKYGHENEIIAV